MGGIDPVSTEASVPRVSDWCDNQAGQDAGRFRASKPEVIVSASSNGGSTRSSDPHEWCNELDAVSGRDSAKLQYL